jgi:hypothetical protein
VKLLWSFVSWLRATNSSSSSEVGKPLENALLFARKWLEATGVDGAGQVIRASGQESPQVAD